MMDLESIRSIFQDKRSHISIAQIKRVEVAGDRSFVRCLVSILPEKREIVAQMTWDSVGPDSGVYILPQVGDLVLVAFADGSDDYVFVIRRLTTQEDRIPLNVSDSDLVLRSLAGKKTWLTSDTRINLSVDDTQPTENLILGQVFKSMMQDILAELATLCQSIATHTHITGGPGSTTSPPIQSSDFIDNKGVFETTKASPVDDNEVLSDLSFTEKG